MKPRVLFLALIVTASLTCPKPADAAIALDFGLNAQDLQNGFAAVTGAMTVTSPLTVPSAALPGGETVTITSSSVLNFRDRGNITNTNYDPYANLYEDYLRAGNGAAVSGTNPFSTLTISVGQLVPLTEYRVTLRLYDGAIAAASAGAYSFDITGTGDTNPLNNSYAISFHGNNAPFPGLSLAEREGYSEMFLADGSGNLQLTVTQTSGVENTIPMNSFELVMIPEPSSACLGSAAGLLMLLRRRRG